MHATTPSTTSRRLLLGTIAAMPAAAAIPAHAVATDPHTEWLADIDIAWERMNAPGPGLPDAEMNRLDDEVGRCQGLIAETPARSIAGIICQITVGYHTADGLADNETGMLSLKNAITALEQLVQS